MSQSAEANRADHSDYVSAEWLWRLKREAQSRDRASVKKGKLPPDAVLLIRPWHFDGAAIKWPEGPLNDG